MRSIAPLAAVACAPGGAESFGEPWDEPVLAADAVPAPYSFDLEATPLVAGSLATLSVSGAPPNASVYFLVSDGGIGVGDCLQKMHGTCLDIQGAPVLLGRKPTDVQGRASYDFTVPNHVGASYVAFQAVVLGAGPAETSDVVGRWIRPAGTLIDPNVDADNDGFAIVDGDCHEGNAAINPLATDIVGDGVDQDCDGADGHDGDGDGFAATWSGGSDCDDTDAARYPLDLDGDGVSACDGDCDDFDPNARPGAPEVCDGADSDCDGQIDRNPLGLDACGVIDTFQQGGDGQADVLFVLDDSASMFEEQTRLVASTDALVQPLWDAGFDVHLGLVTTDMTSGLAGGRLQVQDGLRWIDDQVTALYASGYLSVLFQAGTSGSGEERGFDAVHAALTTHLNGVNAGFYREDADLIILAVSDEDDQSVGFDGVSFAQWAVGLKQGPRVHYHAIVGLNAQCATADVGTEQKIAAQILGGVLGSICATSYEPVMAGVAADVLAASAPTDAFPLSETPLVVTLVVVVVEPDGTTYTVPAGELSFLAPQGAVVLANPPPLGSTVYVSYQPVP